MPVAVGPHGPGQTRLPVLTRDSGSWAHFLGQGVFDIVTQLKLTGSNCGRKLPFYTIQGFKDFSSSKEMA